MTEEELNLAKEKEIAILELQKVGWKIKNKDIQNGLLNTKKKYWNIRKMAKIKREALNNL